MTRHPDHQPLHCTAGVHLWHQGLALAIYNKAGELTNGGKSDTPFYASQETLAKLFRAHINSVHNAMNLLRKRGWLLPIEGKKNKYTYVNHAAWAKTHPGECVERVVQPREEVAA